MNQYYGSSVLFSLYQIFYYIASLQIGYLYLTNVKRLEDVMLKLGFSTGASSE